ncbi:type IX secretion system membrane protein PorP/SprF [Zobellia sp.]|nr:type IX secretion system membrane protein PorP/SprF [Zobellia sp.]
MKKFLLIVLLTTTIFSGLRAQQDAQYTQYMYNTMAINPAYAGSRGVLSIAGLHRSQWVGVEGAPKTQTLNFHTPISDRVGLGLSIVNDDIGNGTSQETYFDGVFSYTIPLSREAKLAFGLKASAHVLNLDFSKLSNYTNEVSGTTLTNIDNKLSPNFGAGVYYYDERFYVGLSVPNFLATRHFDGNAPSSSFLARERMNFYLITGYVYDLNRGWQFKPTLLLKAVNGAPLQVDVSANFMFENKFILGAGYRWDAAISGIIGFQASDQILLGIAYDREVTELGGTRFNDGSFEVVLRYEFRSRYGRRIAPKFF